MARRGSLWRTWLLPVVLTGCSASASDGNGTGPVAAPVAEVCAPGKSGPACAEDAAKAAVSDAPCINGDRGARCDGLLGPGEVAALSDGIEDAYTAVMKSQYADVHALVEEARLQLRRDGALRTDDGPDDAARALRNAMRSVAVDDAAPETRFVLALALARSVQQARSSSEPLPRVLALGMVDVALRSVPAATGAVGAATQALAGYVALEQGDRARARAAFTQATQMDPSLATAWVGLGDLARGEQAFADAESAYRKAGALLPGDDGVHRSIMAAMRRKALDLPAPLASSAAGVLTLTPGPLAPLPPSVLPGCPSAPAAGAPGASLCTGLSDLAKATSTDAKRQAAMLIVDGWNSLSAACDAQDPACGPHAAEAVAAAARAFQSAGKVGRAIAAGKMLLGRPSYPGVAAVTRTVTLEIADRYYAIGIFDQAAGFYARYAQSGGPVAAAGPRALAIHLALGDTGSAQRMADTLARESKYSPAERADWLIATATLARVLAGADEAASWLGQHTALLTLAGRSTAVADLAKLPPERAAGPEACAAPLSCAVRRLAGEGRWSPKAGQLPKAPPRAAP